MKVKICGLTNKDDAVWALNYGADYLGVNFWKESPRHVSVGSAAGWVKELPGFANVIGVFVDAENDAVAGAVQKVGLKGVQLHGSESVESVAALRLLLESGGRRATIIKAFRMKDESALAEIAAYKDVADYFLLDAHVPGEAGGTGATFNWDWAVKAKDIGVPIFLAGGLTPGNVADAAKKVAPFAVDVASGVEKTLRRKDLKKVEEFISHSKAVKC